VYGLGSHYSRLYALGLCWVRLWFRFVCGYESCQLVLGRRRQCRSDGRSVLGGQLVSLQRRAAGRGILALDGRTRGVCGWLPYC